MTDSTVFVKPTHQADPQTEERPSRICTEPIPEHSWERLREDYEFTLQGMRLVIPAGFTYDGASVPGWLGVLWRLTYPPFHPRVRRAAAEHDFACGRRYVGTDYRGAAERFHFVLLEDHARPWKARLMYWAVLVFGPKWE